MFWEAPDIEEIAHEVMCEHEDLSHLDVDLCRIGYQHCDKAKKTNGKTVFADTQLVSEKMKVFCPYDFIITVYDTNCIGIDAEHMKRLMYHELKHVGFVPPNKYEVIPHDIEDFRVIINRWGLDWIRDD